MTLKLKEDVKARWLAALRSGEYQQGRRKLRVMTSSRVDDDGGIVAEYAYCCLGVLCDLSTQDGVGQWEGHVFVSRIGEYESHESGVLPEAVVLWAFEPVETDMDYTSDPVLPLATPAASDGDSAGLARMNDVMGYDFAAIADRIEAAL